MHFIKLTRVCANIHKIQLLHSICVNLWKLITSRKLVVDMLAWHSSVLVRFGFRAISVLTMNLNNLVFIAQNGGRQLNLTNVCVNITVALSVLALLRVHFYWFDALQRAANSEKYWKTVTSTCLQCKSLRADKLSWQLWWKIASCVVCLDTVKLVSPNGCFVPLP